MNEKTLSKFLKGTEILSIAIEKDTLYIFCGNGATLAVHAEDDELDADILGQGEPTESEMLRDEWDVDVEEAGQ